MAQAAHVAHGHAKVAQQAVQVVEEFKNQELTMRFGRAGAGGIGSELNFRLSVIMIMAHVHVVLFCYFSVLLLG